MKRYVFVNPFIRTPLFDCKVIETTMDLSEIGIPVGYALHTITKI